MIVKMFTVIAKTIEGVEAICYDDANEPYISHFRASATLFQDMLNKRYADNIEGPSYFVATIEWDDGK